LRLSQPTPPLSPPASPLHTAIMTAHFEHFVHVAPRITTLPAEQQSPFAYLCSKTQPTRRA
jgi:hypothetical protein